MANQHKKTAQDKIDAERVARMKLERTKRRQRIAMTVFVVVLCIVLVISFCFPALTYLAE